MGIDVWDNLKKHIKFEVFTGELMLSGDVFSNIQQIK